MTDMPHTAAVARPLARPRLTLDTLRVPLVMLSVALTLGAWEAWVRINDVPIFLLPAPSRIAQQAWSDLTSGVIWPHFLRTLTEVLAGFAISLAVAVAVGTLIALNRLAEILIYPYVLVIQTIPKVAIAPLFVIWFGFGIESKIVTAAMIGFFPMLVNVVAGLKSADERRLTLMRAYRAKPFKAYLAVRVPSMLPYLFAGMETGIIFAMLGAIVGEFLGASTGLGALIVQRQTSMDAAGVFSILIFLSLMGLVMNGSIRMLRSRFVFWT